MDVTKFKQAFINKKKAHEEFKKYEILEDIARQEYNNAIFELFEVFKEVDTFPEGRIKIPPIVIRFRDEEVMFTTMSFNVKNGKIVNLYFRSLERDFLKYHELLSWFESENQIDELMSIFIKVRDKIQDK